MPQHGAMARLPAVLGTHDLPLAELCAARIDGELFAIDDGWAPVDEPDLPSLRAAVVALRVPRDLVIERRSAAWVHGALDSPPEVAQFCVSHRERVAAINDHRTQVREVTFVDGDVIDVGGVRCTSALRTAFDLLREPSLADRDVVSIVARLASERPGLVGLLHARLDAARRMPHRARAVERLQAAAAARLRRARPARSRSRPRVTSESLSRRSRDRRRTRRRCAARHSAPGRGAWCRPSRTRIG